MRVRKVQVFVWTEGIASADPPQPSLAWTGPHPVLLLLAGELAVEPNVADLALSVDHQAPDACSRWAGGAGGSGIGSAAPVAIN